MKIPASQDALGISIAKRILNELDSKKLNQRKIRRVDEVKKRDPNSPDYSDMLFQCECDDENCKATISLPTLVYERAHKHPHRFTVQNSHVKTDIEKVVGQYYSYVVVEKLFMVTNKDEIKEAQSRRRREENEVIFRQRNDAIKDIVKTILPVPKDGV